MRGRRCWTPLLRLPNALRRSSARPPRSERRRRDLRVGCLPQPVQAPEGNPSTRDSEGLRNEAEEDVVRELREERTREIPLGPGFVPGDVVGIEMGSLRHQKDLGEVLAVFCKGGAGAESHPLHEITLRGSPERTPLRHRHSSAGGRVSRVTLSAVIPADALPGEYQCRRLEAETHEGRRVPFESVTEAAWRSWRFRVR